MTYYKQKLRCKEHFKFTAAENGNVTVLWWWQSFWSGAKTKTRYICLQCIALTFAESLPKPAEVYAGICSVIWQAFEKSSRSYVDYEQQWMEQSWRKLRAEPLCFKRQGWEELKVYWAHLTLRTYSYLRSEVFLLLNEDVYTQSVPLRTWAITESFDSLSLWKDGNWNTCCLQDGMEIFHYKVKHV